MKLTDEEEIDTFIEDAELFIDVLSLFEKMSKRGKDATIETLITYVLKEV